MTYEQTLAALQGLLDRPVAVSITVARERLHVLAVLQGTLARASAGGLASVDPVLPDSETVTFFVHSYGPLSFFAVNAKDFVSAEIVDAENGEVAVSIHLHSSIGVVVRPLEGSEEFGTG